jgi:hypothetical protein
MAPSDCGAVSRETCTSLVWLVSWGPFGEINMSYILAGQRDRDVVTAFVAYREYLLERRSRFPPAAYALAASEWYFDFLDHRCPHDSWLESVTMGETSMGARHEQRTSTLTIRLLGAYHDGYIEFSYPDVYDYDFRGAHVSQGHGDWRYDEFRLSDSGRVIHEIEWASFGRANRWLIEASDVFHRWIPGVPKVSV